VRKRVGLLAIVAVVAFALAAGIARAQTTPLLQVGGTGAGAGQLDGPVSAAVGPSGDVYVTEVGNRRISEFSGTGEFVRAWGIDVIPGNAHEAFEICTAATGCKAAPPIANASAAGSVRDGEGIAVASNGDVYALDSFNGRINRFSAAGEFLDGFGLDVIPGNGSEGFEICTFVTACQQGDFGSAAGTLGDSFDLAIGPGDELYTIQANLRRINDMTAAGEWIKAWGFDVAPGLPAELETCTIVTGCQVATAGSDAGKLNGPRGIGVAVNGDVLVSNNGRVDEYTPAGAFVRAFGFGVDTGASALEVCTAPSGCQAPVTGGAAGQLSGGTNEIGVVADGTIYVADTAGRRVVAYSPSFAFERAFGFDVDPAGGTGFEVCTTTTGCKLGSTGAGFGQFTSLKGVAVDCRGAIWTTDIENDELTRFGEPGIAPPPCPPEKAPAGADLSPAASPSNAFKLGKAKLNRKKGTAALHVTVPGPGTLAVAGKLIRKATSTARHAGDAVLSIKARGKAKRALTEKGRARVGFTVTFTPTGGQLSSKKAGLLLKLDKKGLRAAI
jgi:tripartite motif-containing protein 71